MRGIQGLGPDGGLCMWAEAAGAWRSTRNACELTQVLDLVGHPHVLSARQWH